MGTLAAFRPQPWNAAGNVKIGLALRYTAQRLVEQQDPNTLFAGSASKRQDPLSSVLESERVCDSFATVRQPFEPIVTELLANTASTLSSFDSVIENLGCESEYSNLKSTLAEAASTNNLLRVAKLLAQKDLPAVQALLVEAKLPFRLRLADWIANAKPKTQQDWDELDEVIDALGGTLLAEGRGGPDLTMAMAKELGAASSHPDAQKRFKALISESVLTMDVAIVLTGVTDPQDLRAYGFELVAPPQRWPGRANRNHNSPTLQQQNDKLVRFRGRFGQGSGRSVVTTTVEAFDESHARTIAEERALKLLDQFSAKHRVLNFDIGHTVLVRKRSSGVVKRLERLQRSTKRATARSEVPIPQLSDSFRYAELARKERNQVVQVLHRWIALEALISTRKPFDTLRTHIPNLLALHMSRQSMTATWTVVRSAGRLSGDPDWRLIEQWLRVSANGHANLGRWAELLKAKPQAGTKSIGLDSNPEEAAGLLEGIISVLNPFAERAFKRWQWRLSRGINFAEWAESSRSDVRLILLRMYALRNSSVHAGLVDADGSPQLAIAARNIVDSSLEVLSLWMDTASGAPASQSLELISARFNRVLEANSTNSGATLIDIERLTLRESDGLSPEPT